MWKLIKKIAQLETPWISLIGESYLKDNDEEVEYWRTESTASVIAVTIQSGNFILPKKQFRPGVGKCTLDFPGGRCGETADKTQIMRFVVQRELGLATHDIQQLTPLGHQGMLVNSSTSNQKLYGFCVQLADHVNLGTHTSFPITSEGIEALLKELECLQCRMLLLEYLRGQKQFF